jgi:anti-sigma factor RsiW
MTCRDALLLLEFARPGATELDAADIAALETHLAGCPTCGAFARSERESTDRLTRAFSITPDAAISVEQLKGQLAAHRRRWLWRRTAIACGVVGFAAATWWVIPGPYFDPYSVLSTSSDQVANRAAANSWLESIDRRFAFPPRFRDRLLIGFEKRNIYRTTAPVLTFALGNSVAKVTVVTERQFRNLHEFTEERVAETSLGSIHIIRDPNIPGVVYLVEVINGPIEPFLERPAAAT